LAAIIIPGQSGTYRHLPGRVTGLLADSGLMSALTPATAQIGRLRVSACYQFDDP
jgi:hypothetical protein